MNKMFNKKKEVTQIIGENFKVHIFHDDYIASGHFGKCYQGYLPDEDRLVLVKRLDCYEEDKFKDFIDSYQRELVNLSKASHRYKSDFHSNIVNVEKYSIIKKKPYMVQAYIVMEYCLQGDLSRLINLRRDNWELFRFGEICTIMRDLIYGYGQLFAENILHQDLKP